MDKKLFINIADHIDHVVDTYTNMKPLLEKLNFDGRQPDLYLSINKLTKYKRKDITDIYESTPEKILQNVFSSYTLTMNVIIIMKKLLDNLKDFSIQSYRGINNIRKKIITDYNKTINNLENVLHDVDTYIISTDYTNTIAEMVSTYIISEFEIIDKELVDNIIDVYQKNKNEYHTALDLSYAMIHSVLYIEDNAKLYNYVTIILEKIKSDILPQIKSKRKNNKTVIQSMLHNMRIIPYSTYKSLTELLSYNGKSKDIDKIIEHYCVSNNTNVLLIYKEDINHTIEYDKWRLLDYEYLVNNDMVHTKKEGINDRIINRFNNINILNNHEDYEDTIKYKKKPGVHYYDKNNPKSNIIETTDGKYFRFMSYTNMQFVPNNRIENIISHKYPSRRLLGYNNILDNELREHISEPIIFEKVSMNQSIMESKIIRYFRKNTKLFSMKSKNKLKQYIMDKFANDFTHIVMQLLGYDINDVSIEFKASIFSQIRTFKQDVKSYAKKQLGYVKYNNEKTINKMLSNIVEMNILGSKNILTVLKQKEQIISTYLS